jgi:dTDP-4-dehydrorhamnose 3,5-epimerase
MEVKPLAIPEVKLISLDAFPDDRGSFTVHWHEEEFKEAVDGHVFRQDSYVTSVPHVVRGLHYQLPPHAQGKLVRCLSGSIQDVAVDIRMSSPTFGMWVDVHLYAHNNEALWIPPGFAHGYASLSEGATVFYKITNHGADETVGVAAFNVQPDLSGSYFNKLECFCFTDMRLKPGETVEVPVVFFVDPAIIKERDLDKLDTITLSYTFFASKNATKPVAALTDLQKPQL